MVRLCCASIQDAVAEQLDAEIAASAIQRRRLKGLRRASGMSLAVLLAAAPLLLPSLAEQKESAPLVIAYATALGAIGRSGPLGSATAVQTVTCYLSVLAVGIVGALGGFLSALLQVQKTRVALMEYQENKFTLQLRPLVGAVLAMLIFILLAWRVVPGISITGAGTYFAVALASGFSERYFLRVLNLGDEPYATTVASESTRPQIAG